MIGLDTGVLLRYLTGDDPKLSPRAAKLLEDRTKDSPVFISLVTLAEAVRTLQGPGFEFTRDQVLHAVGALASLNEVRLQEPDVVRAALATARSTGAAFEQALVATLGKAAGCSHTATFDQAAAAAIPDFSPV
ncbi:MAG: PIN domain-containing protein [Bifidobacteriaceae bacterium]|jgi:predicted nucleic-acid-binding protein|nr:PIN domain-containing protein [Bifidobacteriaceae bacterium]